MMGAAQEAPESQDPNLCAISCLLPAIFIALSSRDFAEPNSSSLAPSMAARGVKVDAAYWGLAGPPCF
eukprot:1159175-Pelagomonas_calceolata.AAC.16